MTTEPTADMLRAMAEHRGLRLVRSRKRTPGTGDYGKFGLDGQARDFGPGPSLRVAMAEEMPAVAANDNHRPAAHCMSALPPNARAIIEPLPVGINQAGRAHASRWRLRFAPRWRPEPDPLTGWTGGGDPLAQVELRFATRSAAERYCRSEGVPFEIRGLAGMRRSLTSSLIGEAPPRLCCSPTGPHALCHTPLRSTYSHFWERKAPP